jgi:hypothetical protein
MVQPINYLAMMPQTNIAAGIEGFGEALQARQKRLAAEETRKQYAADLQQTLQNPTAEAFAQLSAKYPQQREAFKQSWEILSEDQKQSEFLVGSQAFNAIKSGNLDVARNLIDLRIEAMKNSGQNTRNLEAMRLTLDSDPKVVQAELGLVLSAVDPERWKKITAASSSMERETATTEEAVAKAKKAAVDAKFAESNAVLDIEKKGWDIQKLQNDIDISRQNVRIAALNADIARENNVLKRQELEMKLAQAERDRDEKVRTKVADLETANSNIDNMLNTADRILKTPKNVIGSAAGPISSRVLTVSQDTADFEELVNTLGSQAFLAQIPNIKGMGALSNAEGEKLTAALQNFSLRQSPERLVENVREAQRLLMKARKNIAERSGLPQTQPDRPASAPPSGGAPAGGVRVTTPTGQVITFPNQQAADAFKRAAGL